MPLLKRIGAFGGDSNAANRRILAINGDPDPRNTSFCARLCNAYVRGARSAERMVRRLNAGDISFEAQTPPHGNALEAALTDLQWATHLILIFPLLRGEPPPVLCDLFREHLTLRTALHRTGTPTVRMVITTDMPAFLQREAFQHSAAAQRLYALLPKVYHTRQDFVGSIRSMGFEQQNWWLETIREHGARAA